MGIYERDDFRRALAFAHADPGDLSRQMILRDFMLDHGAPDVIADEAIFIRPLILWDIWSFEFIGSGSGSGSGQQYEMKQMEIGKAYLIHCGDWHTFVGRVVAQVGTQTYRMEGVSKISETNNGDCWFDLAAGDKRLRRAASYTHAKTPMVVPLVIAAFEWIGKTPAEDKL